MHRIARIFWFLSAFVLATAPLALAKAPLYPELLEQPPSTPSVQATLHLTDGQVLQDVSVLLWNTTGDEDPANDPLKKVIIKFFRPPLKTSVYLKDVSSIEFEKQESAGGIEPGDPIKLSLKNGSKDRVTYIDGLNNGLTIVYKDKFSGHYQKVYLPVYDESPENGSKKLKIRQIQILGQ